MPRVAVCPNHVAPFTALSDAYFARHSVAVWCASRGFGGKSFLLATLAFAEATTLNASVSVLGGSGEQSERVSGYINQFWNAPKAPRQLLVDDPSKRRVKLTGGNSIEALMASQASVRGGHPQRLRLDEVDVMSMPILDAAFGQPMSKAGVRMQTVLSSTHHNPRGTMTEVLERAAKKKWPVFNWCYKETMAPNGWLDPDDIAQKQKDTTDQMWRVEYDLDAPKPEDIAFLTERVEDMFNKKLGEFVGALGELIILEEADEDGRYAAGVDWAKKRDYTIVWVIRTDVSPYRLVCFLRIARAPWPVMESAVDYVLKKYPGPAYHDANGVGDVAGDNLTIDLVDIFLSGKTRSTVLSNYIKAVESHKIIAPHIEWAYNEHKFATRDDLYGEGHLPDTVCAGALAYHAALNGGWNW